MHPIERLRYVARASGVSHDVLVRETAGALAAFGNDPSGLVTACRRIVARQPTSAPIWWLCARVLCAPDPMGEAWRAVEEMESDPTARELTHALPDGATVCVLGWPDVISDALVRRGDLEVLVVDSHGEGSGLVRRLDASEVEAYDVPAIGLGAAAADADVVLLEPSAVGPDELLAVAGSRAAAATARHAGVEVWMVAGVGRMLPRRMWDALVSRVDLSDPWDADDELVPVDLVDRVVGPVGAEALAEGLKRVDCPVAAELLAGGLV
ncbi:MAG TPA: hypothetical protein VK866_18490 [Acidimicrobiales bacterium]|nr:hypothetical protein [Acidimicrobiales bacterium]